VQKAQRVAATGTDERQYEQSFVGVGSSADGLKRTISRFTGRMTKKYTAAAMTRNAISALRKSP